MIISKKHEFIFIHCHRSAGTTLEQKMFPLLDKGDIIVGSTKHGENLQRNSERWAHWKHATADMISKTYPWYWKNYYKFTTVRNPWDRVVSWFFWWNGDWWKESKSKTLRDIGAAVTNMDFDAYVRSVFSWQTSTLFSYHRMLFTDKFELDVVLRAENLQDDFNGICDKFNIGHVELPIINKSKLHEHYTTYYRSRETRDIVYKQFAKDIEYFGYKFGE